MLINLECASSRSSQGRHSEENSCRNVMFAVGFTQVTVSAAIALTEMLSMSPELTDSPTVGTELGEGMGCVCVCVCASHLGSELTSKGISMVLTFFSTSLLPFSLRT